MPYQATIFRIMLSGPSDTKDARDLAAKLIADWNRDNSFHTNRMLVPIQWEMDSTPAHGSHPQALLNTQLVETSDAIIAISHMRLGSATPSHVSGTAEEISRFAENGKNVYIYFYSGPVPQQNRQDAQLNNLDAFKYEMRSQGLQFSYSDLKELEMLLRMHISKLGHDLANRSPDSLGPINSDHMTFQTFSKETQAARIQWIAMARQDVSLARAREVLDSHRLSVLEFAATVTGTVSPSMEAAIQSQVQELEDLQKPTENEERGWIIRRRFWLSGNSLILRSLEIVEALKSDRNSAIALEPTLAEQFRKSGLLRVSVSVVHSSPQYQTRIPDQVASTFEYISLTLYNLGRGRIHNYSLQSLPLIDGESVDSSESAIGDFGTGRMRILLSSADRLAEISNTKIIISYKDCYGAHIFQSLLPDITSASSQSFELKDETPRVLVSILMERNEDPLEIRTSFLQ